MTFCFLLGHRTTWNDCVKHKGVYCEFCRKDYKDNEWDWGWFWNCKYALINWCIHLKCFIRKFYCPLILWEGWDEKYKRKAVSKTRIVHYFPFLGELPKKYTWEKHYKPQFLQGYEVIFWNRNIEGGVSNE